VYHGGRAEIGLLGEFCLFRFSARRPSPGVLAISSRGKVRRLAATPGPEGSWIADWLGLPGQRGDYRLVATQGRLSASTTFRVINAEAPRLTVIGDTPSEQPVQRLGRPLKVVVAGLPPKAAFLLDIYSHRANGSNAHTDNYGYLTSVPLRATRDGTRVYTFATDPRDAAGTYWIVLRRRYQAPVFACFTMEHRLHPVTCRESTAAIHFGHHLY
jgi:hypothetical protein